MTEPAEARPGEPGPAPAAPARPPTPDETALADARATFEAGNYARLREVAGTLARSQEPAVRAAASELLSKVRVDPVAIWVGLATLALLLSLTYWYALR